jgi:hypothetical protein
MHASDRELVRVGWKLARIGNNRRVDGGQGRRDGLAVPKLRHQKPGQSNPHLLMPFNCSDRGDRVDMRRKAVGEFLLTQELSKSAIL